MRLAPCVTNMWQIVLRWYHAALCKAVWPLKYKQRLITVNLGQKKLIICFSGTARVTFNPPHQKFLLHFQYSHWKIVYTSLIVSLGRQSFAAILFVDWVVHILKVENFSGNYSDTSFFSISFKKNKNKKPPARIIFKKKVPEKHIINFFWPYLV